MTVPLDRQFGGFGRYRFDVLRFAGAAVRRLCFHLQLIVTVGMVVDFKFNYFLRNSVEIYFDAKFGSDSTEANDDLMFQVRRLN